MALKNWRSWVLELINWARKTQRTFETEEKTNKALASIQRQGRLAAIHCSTCGEVLEGLQKHGWRELALGRPRLTWCKAGFGAKAAPSAPPWDLSPWMTRNASFITVGTAVSCETKTKTCPQLPGRSLLLTPRLLCLVSCCLAIAPAAVQEERCLVPSRRYSF